MATFYLNGEEITVTKKQSLLRFLRDELHITSAKDGCSEGACGACTVLINGEPCRACIPDTDRLDGKRVLTVEGLSDFEKAASSIEENYYAELKEDISWFCKKFDYRYEDEPWKNSKDAVERAIRFLEGDLHTMKK